MVAVGASALAGACLLALLGTALAFHAVGLSGWAVQRRAVETRMAAMPGFPGGEWSGSRDWDFLGGDARLLAAPPSPLRAPVRPPEAAASDAGGCCRLWPARGTLRPRPRADPLHCDRDVRVLSAGRTLLCRRRGRRLGVLDPPRFGTYLKCKGLLRLRI